MIEKKRILVACGTSIATATVAATKVKEIAEQAGIPVEVVQCKAGEIRGRVQTFHPHLIVAMTPVPPDLGVPVIMGVPFLSGIGVEKLKEEVLALLKSV
ncbi:MAG: PTS sugar transporter subunit IIB [Anaerolineales bacterium]